MRKINSCLRGVFIGFNVLFAVFGCLLIFGTVKASAFNSQLSSFSSSGLGWAWVFSIGVLAIACLGIYAGYSEKILFLKIFAGFMAVGLVIMMIMGILMAVARNKLITMFTQLTPEVVQHVMRDKTVVEGLQELQHSTQCCGVVSFKDWSDRIPESCRCLRTDESYAEFFGTSSCTSRPMGYSGPEEIYERPCREVIIPIFNMVFKITMAIFFGFAITALLSLVASLFMIHQVKRSDGNVPIPLKSY